MAAVEDLIKQIADPRLRDQLAAEVAKLKSQKKFGLVFEEHLPEMLRLPSMTAVVGSRVQKKDAPAATYVVTEEINGKRIKARPASGGAEEVLERSEVVVVRAFGEAMYPALSPVETIERGGPDKPWHVLINADNFHALQLLLYGYEGKVDVVYIDPPYNSGARDWKYNNDYVDDSDQFRHSKWLSMIKKRLLLAKRLLRSDDGVLFVTIDEHEVHHLGILLSEIFPEHYRQMVTIVINPKGVTQGRFSRVEEYMVCCFGPRAIVTGRGDDLLTPEVDDEGEIFPRWKGLLRSGTNAERKDRKNMFYPVLLDRKRGAIVGAGDPLPFDKAPPIGKKIDGFDAAWPVRTDGTLGNWGVGHTTLRHLISKGYVALGQYDDYRKTWGISYLSKKLQAQIAAGVIEIVKFDEEKNVVAVRYSEVASRQIKAVWHRTNHDAGAYGSDLLRTLLGKGRVFSFPKSVYAVRDSLAAVARHRPNAVILDFFAGSGTTLHATAMLNAEDGGSRQCLLATNNEVTAEAAATLARQGYGPGRPEWEREGIAEAVTWPRVRACLSGLRPDGSAIPGEYLDGREMADGFEENAAYFRLDFLDPTEVTRGDRFASILPILWMLAGCKGAPEASRGSGKWFIPKHSPFGVLLKEDEFAGFAKALAERPDVTHAFLVTDSTDHFHRMSRTLGKTRRCIQLYRSYIDTFRINLSEPGTISAGGVPVQGTPATTPAPANERGE